MASKWLGKKEHNHPNYAHAPFDAPDLYWPTPEAMRPSDLSVVVNRVYGDIGLPCATMAKSVFS